MKDNKQAETVTAGGAIFGKLKALGVDYVFVNSGTDFPPIIEGLAEAEKKGIDLPKPIIIPHEHAALGMAHGYYNMTGKTQSVMLHTNVGLSNGATGVINAACDHIPVIVMSGRTPVMEQNKFGARTVPIGWGQEMFDQTSLVREPCKWDYELRFPEQISGILDRAYSISNSTPKGPVYLSLPREVLCESCPSEGIEQESSIKPVRSFADPEALTEAATLLANAKRPVVISQRGVGGAESFATFQEMVEAWALPVSQYWATHLSIPTKHPMHIGANPNNLLNEADVVLVVNCLAPWWPDQVNLPSDCKVIHIGPDPLFAANTPVRNFRSDIALVGETEQLISALAKELNEQRADHQVLESRRERIAELSAANQRAVEAEVESGKRSPMTKAWVSHCLSEAIKGETAKTTVLSELGCPLAPLDLDQPDQWYQEPHSGGLGWSLPTALGTQLADKDRLVFCTLGDGSYMFANPTACHQIAESMELPVITLVLNNEEWGAVRQSVLGMYPDGFAAQAHEVPLTGLLPSPDFTHTAAASRAHTETVANAEDLPAALQRAIEIRKAEKRQVVLNICIARDGAH